MGSLNDDWLDRFVSESGLERKGVEGVDELLEKLRILDELSLLLESNTTDSRLRAEADGRLRMVGSDMLAMVLSIAAAANANSPPDLGFLPPKEAELVEALSWC